MLTFVVKSQRSTGSFTRLCSASVVTSLQNIAHIIIGSHALQCSDRYAARDRPSKATFFADTHNQPVTMLEQIATQHQAKYELEIALVMASARTDHLVGHKIQIQHCRCPSEDFLICFNFASRFGEYLTSLIIA